MAETMFTIGYQGASLERLVQTLNDADVTVLLDTRETPMSRRPEFRRSVLQTALEAAGIRYVSLRWLGAPKDLRGAARPSTGRGSPTATGTGYPSSGKSFGASSRCSTPSASAFSASSSDPAACHRSLLAHEIEGLLDVSAVHLDPRRGHEPDDHEGLARHAARLPTTR